MAPPSFATVASGWTRSASFSAATRRVTSSSGLAGRSASLAKTVTSRSLMELAVSSVPSAFRRMIDRSSLTSEPKVPGAGGAPMA